MITCLIFCFIDSDKWKTKMMNDKKYIIAEATEFRNDITKNFFAAHMIISFDKIIMFVKCSSTLHLYEIVMI